MTQQRQRPRRRRDGTRRESARVAAWRAGLQIAGIAAVVFVVGVGLGVGVGRQWLDAPVEQSERNRPLETPAPQGATARYKADQRPDAAERAGAPAAPSAGKAIGQAQPDRDQDATVRPPWRRFAVAPPAVPAGAPRVAIVIDDMGMNRRNTRAAIALPPPLTMAFLSYAPDLPEVTSAARRAGHELLVHVPMQPRGADADPGPKVLTTDLPAEALRTRLDWALSRFSGYVGINNHMGSAMTADREGMRLILAELKRRGLLFLDSRTTARSVAVALSETLDVPHAARDLFLDNVQDVAAIKDNLLRLERIARKHGTAIAIGHPYDSTLAALRAWIPQARRRGIALVPISAVVRGGSDADRLAEAGG